jgi:hypothetical protein
MPLFFLIAIGAGVITVGATATDAKRWTGGDRRMAEAAFDASAYQSPADCLNAASHIGAPLDACDAKD